MIPLTKKQNGHHRDDEPTAATPATEESDDYREHFRYTKDVCALSWWEPLRLLQEGSISDIHLVRRRDNFVKVRGFE